MLHTHLSSGVRSGKVDTANTGTVGLVALGNSDVTVFTPSRSPGVSDDPGISSVTDDSNTVIKAGTAGGGVDDTTSVVLERSFISFDGDGDNLLSNSGLKSLPVLGRDVLEALVFEELVGTSVLALTVNTLVWVVIFGSDTVLGDVVKSIVHKTSVATVVLLGAINELLFREGLRFSVGLGIETFESSNGGESPA